MTDPYESPKADAGEAEPVHKEHALTGPPCPECDSVNTSIDSVLRPRPSILAVIVFSWYFLLVRGALATRKSICLDCLGDCYFTCSDHRDGGYRSWVVFCRGGLGCNIDCRFYSKKREGSSRII